MEYHAAKCVSKFRVNILIYTYFFLLWAKLSLPFDEARVICFVLHSSSANHLFARKYFMFLMKKIYRQTKSNGVVWLESDSSSTSYSNRLWCYSPFFVVYFYRSNGHLQSMSGLPGSPHVPLCEWRTSVVSRAKDKMALIREHFPMKRTIRCVARKLGRKRVRQRQRKEREREIAQESAWEKWEWVHTK